MSSCRRARKTGARAYRPGLLRATGVGVAAVAVLLVTACGGNSGKCGKENSSHCYATASFRVGTGGFQSAQSLGTVIHMTPGNGYFITNEMWVRDGSFSPRWIEVGEITYNGASPSYFWADRRPGHDFSIHDLAEVPSQSIGRRVLFQVRRELNTPTYHVYIFGAGENFTDNSIDDTLDPYTWTVGEELAGDPTGAKADTARFDNLYFCDNAGTTHGEPMLSQPLLVYKPPYGSWSDGPQLTDNPGGGSGTLTTSCCVGAPPPNAKAPTGATGVAAPPTQFARPTGSPAIRPLRPTAPAFPEQAAASYAQAHPFPNSITGTPLRVPAARFIRSEAVPRFADGSRTDLPAGKLVCYVLGRGALQFAGSPGRAVRYGYGYEVFDATSGNLLLAGGLSSGNVRTP